jgi:hypothetical protein
VCTPKHVTMSPSMRLAPFGSPHAMLGQTPNPLAVHGQRHREMAISRQNGSHIAGSPVCLRVRRKSAEWPALALEDSKVPLIERQDICRLVPLREHDDRRVGEADPEIGCFSMTDLASLTSAAAIGASV